MGETAAKIDATSEALDIGKGRPDRSIEVIQLHIGRDEAVTPVEADGGTYEGTINIDNM